jgi:hypothetical protein
LANGSCLLKGKMYHLVTRSNGRWESCSFYKDTWHDSLVCFSILLPLNPKMPPSSFVMYSWLFYVFSYTLKRMGIFLSNPQASKVLKLERNSLEFLLHHFCGVTINKEYIFLVNFPIPFICCRLWFDFFFFFFHKL